MITITFKNESTLILDVFKQLYSEHTEEWIIEYIDKELQIAYSRGVTAGLNKGLDLVSNRKER